MTKDKCIYKVSITCTVLFAIMAGEHGFLYFIKDALEHISNALVERELKASLRSIAQSKL